MNNAHAPAPGILLVNLGTPDEPTAPAVRRYLGEFLSDTRVVEIPAVIWRALLYLIILPRRSPRVAKNYATIWSAERGSPLRFHTEDQAQQLQTLTGVPVAAAFRYGNPSLAKGMKSLRERGVERIIVLPMYPQNSATTTATILDKLADLLRKERDVPDLQFISAYPEHPQYIKVLADSVREHWEQNGRGEKLVMSFHGLPARNVKLGDPYQGHCERTANALARALELADDEWMLTYQSRFGPARWLEPYTEPSLEELAKSGIRAVDVICPGFLADCLETLEEISIGARETFIEAGGEQLRYIPALNADERLTALFAELAGFDSSAKH